MRNEQYYEAHIAALKADIEIFGAAGDDLQRLRDYEQELKEIRERVAQDTAKGE